MEVDKLEVIHYWVSLEDDGSGYIRNSAVDDPAIGETYELFNKQDIKIEKFEEVYTQQFEVVDEDRRIAKGPVMVPDLLMLRKKSDGTFYYGVFSKEAIFNTVVKAGRNNLLNEFNLQHVQTEDAFIKVTCIESIILESDKPKKYEKLPDGTWILSFYVESQEDWDRLKNGNFTGFSVEVAIQMIPDSEWIEDYDEEVFEAIEMILNSKHIDDDLKIHFIKQLL